MAVSGTERALTVDANVVNLYFTFIKQCPLPQGLSVRRIGEFSNGVLEECPIAINRFIRNEYEQTAGYETIKNWLAKRFQKDLAVEVECLPISNSIKSKLRDDYGFDCNSRDATYLQTCANTYFKLLVTENKMHFNRPHRNRRQRSMCRYLERELSITIHTIDGCCSKLLDDMDT